MCPGLPALRPLHKENMGGSLTAGGAGISGMIRFPLMCPALTTSLVSVLSARYAQNPMCSESFAQDEPRH